MKNIFKFILKFPKSLLSIFVFFGIYFVLFAPNLQIDASTQTLLLENDKDLAIWREVSKRYETPNFLVIAYTPNQNLFDKKSLDKINKISNELLKLKSVKSVTSILNVPLLENKKAPINELIDNIPSLNSKDVNLKAAKNEFITSPIYKNSLVSADFRTTAIVVNLLPNTKYNNYISKLNHLKDLKSKGKISAQDEANLTNLQNEFKTYRDELRVYEHENLSKIKNIIALNKENEGLFLGGMEMIADDMISFVKKDLITYGLGVGLLLIFSLWLFFRQVRFVILPILICAISLIYANALFAYLGFEITVISSNYVALQLIITVSLIIHLITSYREFYGLHPGFSQRQLIFLALNSRFKPCLFAVLTTIIGFASLTLSNIKPIISLGIMMSLSIGVSLIVVFVLFASSMMLLKKKPPQKSFENNFTFTKFCAFFSINHKNIVFLVSFLVLIFGLFGISKLKVENSFIGYFKSSTDIYQGMKAIDQNLGGTVPLDIVIKFKTPQKELTSQDDDFDDFEAEFSKDANAPEYWFTPSKIKIISKVNDFLNSREFIGNVSSLGILLEVGKKINNGQNLDPLMLSLMYKNLPEDYKKILLSPFVSFENNEAHFIVRTIDSDENLKRNEFINNLRKDLNILLKDDEVDCQVSGIMILYNNMLQSLVSSQISTLGFSILALFLTFIFVFKSIKFAFIAIISTIIPLSGVFGVMGILGINLDIMSITIAAISLGIGVDDIIHYIYRYKLERKTKNTILAIKASHASIGYAMYYTSFAIFLGFSVMMTSNFWPTIYFGFLTDLVMALMLLGALFILPSLILIIDKNIVKKA